MPGSKKEYEKVCADLQARKVLAAQIGATLKEVNQLAGVAMEGLNEADLRTYSAVQPMTEELSTAFTAAIDRLRKLVDDISKYRG